MSFHKYKENRKARCKPSGVKKKKVDNKIAKFTQILATVNEITTNFAYYLKRTTNAKDKLVDKPMNPRTLVGNPIKSRYRNSRVKIKLDPKSPKIY